jgi:hypothetical protein
MINHIDFSKVIIKEMDHKDESSKRIIKIKSQILCLVSKILGNSFRNKTKKVMPNMTLKKKLKLLRNDKGSLAL